MAKIAARGVPRTLPVILSPDEVRRFIVVAENLKRCTRPELSTLSVRVSPCPCRY
jgi:hypothetical protein